MSATIESGGKTAAGTAEIDLNAFYREVAGSPDGLSSAEAKQRLEKYGPNALDEKAENALLKFLSFFWGPIPWMIEAAAILSAIVGHWVDLEIIVTLLVFNAVVGFWQEHQASNAVAALKMQLALKARVKRDGQWAEIDAISLVPGDIVRVRLGDIIPADARLTEGDYLSVDQSALTGESLPVEKKTGDLVYSSSVAKQGEMVALVTATGASTYFGKTAKLVSSAKSVSHFQKAVLTIGDFLIYVSLGLATILLLTMLARGEPPLTLFQFGLILVVAAIPVAMPAVLSVTMAIGAVELARKKAILTRLESIEEMAGMDILCSDKTGTLTQNKLTLGDAAVFDGKDAQELILAGALASKAEDRDAIDMAVLGGVKDPHALAAFRQIKFVPFDPVHKRTEAEIQDPDGAAFKVTKGAPQVILALCQPTPETAGKVNDKVNEFAGKGYRTLGVARKDGAGPWQFLGLLPLFDPPREDSAQTIREAKEHGIQVKMVTGDDTAIARQIAGQLGLGVNIHTADEFFQDVSEDDIIQPKAAAAVEAAEGFARVFPEHKYQIVKALQTRGHIVGMTGDGVNDAPALKQADTGIAVSGATDAARAAAALVLTAPGLSVIIQAVETARRIFERMNSYAIYRITETIRIMFFVVLAMIVFKFYPITTIMIILLALLNDLPILTIAYDNTWLDPKPVRWDMRRVLTIASVLGLIGVAETFGILVIAKEGFHLTDAQIQSFIYLKLAVAGHMTLFVARTRRPFLTRPFPAPILLAAILGTQMLAACIVGFGWLVTPIAWKYVGFVWAYCIVWVFIEDWAKMHVYHHLELSASRHRKFLGLIKEPLLNHTASH
ncbi:MAG TPA: plasma-membrane proton-efflux P-type ATPase [Chthoniobacteraceae bacterium]|jgi:H+-transporting ATPase|nr:plasma-membrane proton-efflux P-type ATPase [Chthoniobacteraceae bacterium]